jgi:putative nucleotidyltransferase-like protein
MISLFEELRSIGEKLAEEGIPYALVGGLAYSFWVETRATEDIDLLISEEDWDRMPNLLEPLGYLPLAAPMDFSNISIRRLTKFVGSKTLVLDFLLARTDELRRGIEEAKRFRYEGQEYVVARPEVIISLKEGRMSAKDKSDIEGLRRVRVEGEG